MSVFKIRAYIFRPLGRIFCSFLAGALFYSASADGVNSLLAWPNSGPPLIVKSLQRRVSGHFSDQPTPVFLGDRPGRDPIGRGGWWTPRLLRDLKASRLEEAILAPLAIEDLAAALTPISVPAVFQLGEGGGGGEAGGEGGGPGGGSGGTAGGEGSSQLNSNTGNRHASFPVVSWSARGASGINFALHHNSKGAYSFDLGKGWSHGYDAKVAYSAGSSAIVRYGDGLEVPYTESAGLFNSPAGDHSNLAHHSNGTWTLTSKGRSKLEFNAAGRLVAVKDPNGNTVTVNRDSNQKILSVADGTGRSLNFAYNAAGLVSAVTDPASRTWTLTYDTSNNLVGIGYPSLASLVHSRTFTYNSASDMLSETDLRGQVWAMAYDASERLTSFTNPLGQTSTWSYSSSAATLTLPNGKTIIHNYSEGLISSRVDQAGFSTAYVYDADKNVIRLTDRRGKLWLGTFDTAGNLLTATNPLGKTTTYSYSAGNDLLSVTDPLGHTNTYTYDTNGNLLTHADGLGRVVITNTYNNFGELSATTDPMGRASSLAYNAQGDVVQSIAPSGEPNFASYDVLGRVTSVIDAAGNTTTVAYDEWGRPVSTVEPGSAITSLAYDFESNIVSATDPLGNTGSRAYDGSGRLTSTVNAKGETTTYSYNSVGDLTAVTNGRGYTRAYSYTDRGETATLTLPDLSVEEWAYDGEGNTTAYINPLGQTIAYAYDGAGQQTLVDYPTGLTDTTFSYDAAGRATAMSDASGTSSWTYNAGDEITGLVTPQGSLTYTYNLAGQIVTMVDSGVGTTTTAYDSAGRISTLTDAFGDVLTYTYDSAGRISRKDNPNFSYDNRNRPTAIVTKNSGGTVLQSRTYTFDLASQVSQVVEGGITTSYGYDAIGQLISETKSSGYAASYIYDSNGNRLTRTVGSSTEIYSYDAADKLLSITGGADSRTFAYDAAGRTTGITRGSGTTSYVYDFKSRLTSVAGPGISSSFSYNGLDTRVGMTDSTGIRSFKRNGVGVTSPLLSDGSAVFTPSGENRGGTKTTFHSSLKSLDVQTSSAGSISASRTYDAFGNDLSLSGSWASRFAYAGGFGYQQDPDSGLKLLGHRYYDSSTGRFLTRDPAKDGRNWYAYCTGNPVCRADPTGEVGPLILLAAVAAIMILSTPPAVAPSEPNQSIDWERFAWQKAELAIDVGTLPLGGGGIARPQGSSCI